MSRSSSFDVVSLSSAGESFDCISQDGLFSDEEEERIVYPKASGEERALVWAEDEEDDLVVLDPLGASVPVASSTPADLELTPAISSLTLHEDPTPALDIARPVPAPSLDGTAAPITPQPAPVKKPGKRARRRARAAQAAAASASVATPASAKAAKRKAKRKAKKAKKAKAKAKSPATAPSTATATAGAASTVVAAPAKAKSKASKRKKQAPKAAAPAASIVVGFGTRPLVEEEDGKATSSKFYEEAVRYITSFLKDPLGADASSRLAFLQALIIELGLYTPPPTVSSSVPTSSHTPLFTHIPDLPRSLTAATALLKSSVFLNVRDYLALRDRGLSALRAAMHPSRAALRRELTKNKGKRAALGWVKESGLGVLLVSTWH
ncbi:hypothetical protein PUNSTDRAFT_116932 [Punctularia strigosozonata HHB-11173 SS5]|uniref:Uncharacterized protein n=1 Tax=Punctularia strigosozonata (strain HHB-11173) TaxID=741275 RepID=R7S090_PUNST|nr:uncharacterized protein PUNSTDRAFT_116932 [Punctularia strigosozonata HHB-11173 SS5]EIN03658.1 hypothetical protein PUNSTDRAFT_116932 [Punctularia strigosozonata HHB-11173 SS5]